MSENLPGTDPKIEAVQQLYAAFGQGDMETVLAMLADDVDWATEASSTSAPWFGHFRGKAEVPGFFQALGTNVQVTEYVPLSITSNDTDVMTVIRCAYTVPATGKSTQMHMLHWWRFADGKVVFFRGTEDTEQTANAFK